MNRKYTIHTDAGPRPATYARAVLHAARTPTGFRAAAVTAPRGRKGALMAAAAKIAAYRLRSRTRVPRPYLHQRLETRLIDKARTEIRRRGLSRPACFDDFAGWITDRDIPRRLFLYHMDGWYKYSSRTGSYFLRASYLCGTDDGQPFAVRVPGTIKKVSDAVVWLTPARVHRAAENGQPWKRQGDIFFTPLRLSRHDMRALEGTDHVARPRKNGGLTIVHPQHTPVILSGRYTWRAFRSSALTGPNAD